MQSSKAKRAAKRHAKHLDSQRAFDRIEKRFKARYPELSESGYFAAPDPLELERVKRGEKALIELGKRIGRAGWTFPGHMTFRELADIVRATEPEDSLDPLFVRLYE